VRGLICGEGRRRCPLQIFNSFQTGAGEIAQAPPPRSIVCFVVYFSMIDESRRRVVKAKIGEMTVER
jgi:hypothetical protein